MAGGLRSLFRKERVSQELDEELNGFLEMAAEEKMKEGMSRADALRAVRLEQGSLEVAKETVRAAGWESFLETCWQDLRYGQRVLRKSPGFAIAAVLTLALGIGATTAIFSVVNTVLLRPLGMEDPSHVVFVQETWRDIFPGVALGNFADLKRQSTSFAELCASHNASFNLEARELPERVDGEIAKANYFEMPRLDQTRIDASTLAFACAVALLSSFLFGLAPALRSASTRLSEVFKSSSGISGGSRDRVRSLLVVGEVSLALILMACAGLLIRSALLVSHLDPGFDISNVVVGRVGLPDPGYHDPALARQTFERMISATAALPGVKLVAVVSRAPLAGGGGSNGLLAEGKPFDMANLVNSQLQIISPSYLSTARVPLKAGRDFAPQDTRDRTLVTIVNETLARTMWPSESPIGKRFACCEAGPKGRMDPVWHEVVGVVADIRAWGLDRQVQPEFYIPLAQMPASAWDWIGRTMDLMVRTRGGGVPIHELQSTVASVAPAVPIYRLSTMQQKISSTLERSHFDTFLLAIFATTALLLSSVGIYGVLSYMVAQRTRDIGIRMALGASQAQIVWDILGFGVRLAGLGLAVGLAAALAATRLLSSLLYGVRPTDGVTFAAVSFILLVVAVIASYLPARRATRVDPLVALRYE